MKRQALISTLIGTIIVASSGVVWADDDDGLGPYIRGGVALGWANVDDDFVGLNVSNGVNAGFEASGGWRFTPALAGEASIIFITGGDVEVNGAAAGGAETQAIAFTVDLKVYPLMFSAEDANGTFQPYVRAGIGGGSGELKNAGGFTGSEGTFLARFGGGLDVMFTENLGVYGDGSYFITNKDIIVGVGTVSAGAIFKF